jgi:hypothetical protein
MNERPAKFARPFGSTIARKGVVDLRWSLPTLKRARICARKGVVELRPATVLPASKRAGICASEIRNALDLCDSNYN